MKDHLITCPLCMSEIPFDSEQCSYCGALLTPGPSRQTPILKGIQCLKCGAKNYNYDSCDQCGEPFTKTCPNCSASMGLRDQICAECGLSSRRFNSTRRRRGPEEAEPEAKPKSRKLALLIPIVAALLIAAFGAFYSLSKPTAPTPEEGPKSGEARGVDVDGDGKIDHWNVYGENGTVVERRYDNNNDGVIEKDEFLDAEGKVRYAFLDADGDGRLEETRTFDKNEKTRIAYFYEGDRADIPTRMEIYNTAGRVVERYEMSAATGAIGRYQRFDVTGRLLLEGSDTKDRGYIDLYLEYRDNKQIYRRLYDEDGDGVVEKRETLNAEGIRISVEEDTDGDGLWNQETFFHITGTTRWIQLDTNRDGIYDTFKSYTQDGKFARTGLDTNGDEKPDSWK